MESFNTLWVSVEETIRATFPAVLAYLPSLVGALAVLLFGWLLARLVRGAATRILGGLNGILERTFPVGLLASARVPLGTSRIFGEVAFWVIVFATLTIAARIAQLPTISRWLNEIVLFIPDILLGLATIAIGFLISTVVGEQVTETTSTSQPAQSRLLGLLAQSAVFLVASIIGLDQIGVDVTFLITLSSVAIGSVLLSFSIAFGFGSRDYMRNLISARTVRQNLSPGLLVRIGEVEGEVLEITETHIVIDAETGRALVPAQIAEASGVLIIALSSSAAGGES